MVLMNDFRKTVRDALGNRAASRVARDAGLPPDAILRVLRGRDPLLSNARAVAEAVGLDFQIGPMGVTKPPPWEDLRNEITDLRKVILHADSAPVDGRVGELEADLQHTEAELDRLRAQRSKTVVADGLTDETDPDAKPIPVHRLQTAAGSGAFDLDETVKTYAYFRSEWLFRKGLAADRCNIIGVAGKSMEPTLPDGCVILVDRNRTKRYRGHIFVVRTEDGLVVKRAGKGEGGGWQLVSDHPEWKPQPWPYGTEVIGEVKWMAREF